MQLLKITLNIFIATQFVLVVSGACICNEKGVNGCQACSGSTIVRPKQKYYEPSDINLSPIGDTCWCSKLLIEPATLPKTCGKKEKKPKCECNSCSKGTGTGYCSSSYEVKSYGSDAYGASLYDKIDYAHPTKPKDDSPPADPISVSLALKAGKAIEVPEAKLAYGFAQKPVDGLEKVFFSTVPEENLFKLKSEVITLKKRPAYSNAKYEEEVVEAYEPDSSLVDEDDSAPQLTYKQLGYEPEQYKNPKFRKLSRGYTITSSDDDHYDGYKVAGKVSIDGGFKPGRISYCKKAKKISDYN